MKLRRGLPFLFAVSAVGAQEPASFDLKSDAVRQIVNRTAATQFALVEPVDSVAEVKPAEFVYVPPEKAAAPVRPVSRPAPARAPTQGPLSDPIGSIIDILVDEWLGQDDVDDIEMANSLLRCRVQKDIKSSPPGVDRCPEAD